MARTPLACLAKVRLGVSLELEVVPADLARKLLDVMALSSLALRGDHGDLL